MTDEDEGTLKANLDRLRESVVALRAARKACYDSGWDEAARLVWRDALTDVAGEAEHLCDEYEEGQR